MPCPLSNPCLLLLCYRLQPLIHDSPAKTLNNTKLSHAHLHVELRGQHTCAGSVFSFPLASFFTGTGIELENQQISQLSAENNKI